LSSDLNNRNKHSFPTRRSSDLSLIEDVITPLLLKPALDAANLSKIEELTMFGSVKYGMFLSAIINFLIVAFILFLIIKGINASRDRKSTRLNSSHVKISYAVFC